jgi:hypothetical protein
MRILRGVGGRSLPCGCLVGIYETYDTKTIALVDARGPGCLDTAHRVDAAVAIDLLAADRWMPAGRPQ